MILKRAGALRANALLRSLACVVAFALATVGPVLAAPSDGLLSGTPKTPPSLLQPKATATPFLDPTVAFPFTLTETETDLTWQWQIEPGYYLYKKRFAVTGKIAGNDKPITLNTFALSEGAVTVDDPDFGRVDVYYHQTRLTLAKNTLPNAVTQVTVSYQGCAEAGLCYPPQYTTFDFTPTAGSAISHLTDTPMTPSSTHSSAWNRLLTQASLPSLLALFFFGGLLLTFTPCVLPMIPILSTIILGDADNRTEHPVLRGFFLSLSYVLGMALTFAGTGVLAGVLGAQFNLQIYMQSPWVLIPFAVLFVVLAMAMFGFYELQLPAAVRDRLTHTSAQLKGGQLISVFLIGALSALIVSPCVSAPLAGALAYISTTGDAWLGGLGLLALGLGMGTPLLIIGTTGAKVLPKQGAWMEHIKHFFGVLLLGVALVLIERLIPESISLVLWSLLLGIYAVHIGAFEQAQSGWAKTCKGAGLFLFLYSVLLFVGAIQGHKSLWPPLPTDPLAITSSLSNQPPTAVITAIPHPKQAIVIHSQAQLESYLDTARSEHKLVMIDVYADWCIACKEMENNVLHTPEVSSKLAQLYWLKFDITDFNDDHKALLSRYQLFGPPAFLFFGFDGHEIPAARLVGEVNQAEFLAHLDQFDL